MEHAQRLLYIVFEELSYIQRFSPRYVQLIQILRYMMFVLDSASFSCLLFQVALDKVGHPDQLIWFELAIDGGNAWRHGRRSCHADSTLWRDGKLFRAFCHLKRFDVRGPYRMAQFAALDDALSIRKGVQIRAIPAMLGNSLLRSPLILPDRPLLLNTLHFYLMKLRLGLEVSYFRCCCGRWRRLT